MTDVVCVTGATGYLGSYVVKDALGRGYRVRAAVRDPEDQKKTAHLRALSGAAERLAIVRGDLDEQGSFDAAFRGARFVVHTASAVALSAKDPQKEIVDVAVRGAKNVIRAAKVSGSVERVVMTSSIAAVHGGDKPAGYVFTEADWNDAATVRSDAYATSKVQAERAARALAEEPGDRALGFVAILPSLILGPVMTEQHLRTSPAFLFELMRGAWPAVPNFHFQVVDVRDVAAAHLRALEVTSPAERYACTTGKMGLREMAAILSRELPEAKVPTRRLPDVAMYLAALFDERVTFGFLKRNLGEGAAPAFDNAKIRRDLGIRLRALEETVIDTGRSIASGGYLTK
jgi:dihydroflavonol-4-reductase